MTCPQPFYSLIDDLGCNLAPFVPQFPHLYPQRGFTDVKSTGHDDLIRCAEGTWRHREVESFGPPAETWQGWD